MSTEETYETRMNAELEQQMQTLRMDRRRNERLRADFRKSFQIGLEFTSEEARYITQPSETVDRNRELKTMFNDQHHITIIDAFACVGGDSVSFIHAFEDGCSLHAVQRAENEEEMGRCDRLRRNLFNATQGRGMVRHHVYNHPISETLPEIKRKTEGKIDLLFLDPPWFDRGEKLNMDNICILLESNVFEPMKQCTLAPTVICIKLDFSADDLSSCETFTRMTEGYTTAKTIHVVRNHRPVYHFHILKRNEPLPVLESLLSVADSKLNSILLDLQ